MLYFVHIVQLFRLGSYLELKNIALVIRMQLRGKNIIGIDLQFNWLLARVSSTYSAVRDSCLDYR